MLRFKLKIVKIGMKKIDRCKNAWVDGSNVTQQNKFTQTQTQAQTQTQTQAYLWSTSLNVEGDGHMRNTFELQFPLINRILFLMWNSKIDAF